jgi:hypothetical protein
MIFFVNGENEEETACFDQDLVYGCLPTVVGDS